MSLGFVRPSQQRHAASSDNPNNVTRLRQTIPATSPGLVMRATRCSQSISQKQAVRSSDRNFSKAQSVVRHYFWLFNWPKLMYVYNIHNNFCGRILNTLLLFFLQFHGGRGERTTGASEVWCLRKRRSQPKQGQMDWHGATTGGLHGNEARRAVCGGHRRW